jgi:prevent-host-death family protein
MHSVPIHQAKNQLSELIRLVEQGEEVVLTRHSRRVIRLIKEPEAVQPSIEARRQAIEAEIRGLRAKVAATGADRPDFNELWTDIKRERDGRSDSWTEKDAGR